MVTIPSLVMPCMMTLISDAMCIIIIIIHTFLYHHKVVTSEAVHDHKNQRQAVGIFTGEKINKN